MSDPDHALAFERRPPYDKTAVWLLGLLACAVVLVALWGQAAEHSLRYERQAVLDAGQYWRLLTAHFVHLSPRHLALNLVGLALLALLFPRHYSAAGWAVIAVASMLAIAAGFIWNEPRLEWYVGLSGVLHGGLAAGAVAWWRQEPARLAGALTALVAGKLVWEQVFGGLPLSGGEPVIVAAHLYGAIGGALAGLTLVFILRRWPRAG